jgi:hypothetical protein
MEIDESVAIFGKNDFPVQMSGNPKCFTDLHRQAARFSGPGGFVPILVVNPQRPKINIGQCC